MGLDFPPKISVFYVEKSRKRNLNLDRNAASDPGTPKMRIPDGSGSEILLRMMDIDVQKVVLCERMTFAFC